VGQCGWVDTLPPPAELRGDELAAKHDTGPALQAGSGPADHVHGFRSGNAVFLVFAQVGGDGNSVYAGGQQGSTFMEVGAQLCTHLRICGTWSPGRGSAGPSASPSSSAGGASPTSSALPSSSALPPPSGAGGSPAR
jgi:hypothetical protein